MVKMQDRRHMAPLGDGDRDLAGRTAAAVDRRNLPFAHDSVQSSHRSEVSPEREAPAPPVDHDQWKIEHLGLGASRTEDFGVPVVIAQHDRMEPGSVQMAQECEHTSLGAANGTRNLQASAMQYQ
jgi:hypothetical protein